MSFVLLIIRRPPRSTRTATLFPYTSLFLSLGKTAASLGTLGAVGNGFAKPVALTTPDPVTLYRTVAQIASMGIDRSEEHTSQLQSLMRISYAVFSLTKTKTSDNTYTTIHNTNQHTINKLKTHTD